MSANRFWSACVLSCVTLVSWAATPPATLAQSGRTYCVSGLSAQGPYNFLVMRFTPSLQSQWRQDLNLRNGDCVEVLGESGEFYRVRYQGRYEGWSAKAYLVATGNLRPAPAAAPAASPYMIEGLAIGAYVNFGGAVYREYRCEPSSQFRGFSWCTRQVQAQNRNGSFVKSYSLLHNAEGRVAYVNVSFDPAFFNPGEDASEIARLNRSFGQSGVTRYLPQRSDAPRAVISQWGNLSLEPLGPAELSQLAAGRSPNAGILIDYIGQLKQSAQMNLPVFRIAGGSGYIWSASFDANGIGHLRLTAIDAAVLAPPPVVATDVMPRTPRVPASNSGENLPPDIIAGCQGEGCGSCTSDDKPSQKSLVLYQAMDIGSAVLARVRPNEMVGLRRAYTRVISPGRALVTEVKGANPKLAVGDEIHTVFYLGEGNYKAKKGDEWVTWDQDEVKIRELVPSRFEEWFELLSGNVRGFSNIAPFETYCG